MTVYVLAQLKFTHKPAYERYQARFMDVLKQHQGRLLIADESPQVIEGDWDRDKLVVFSFGSAQQFRDWAQSPEYQHILRDRKEGAEAIVLLAQGVGTAREQVR